MTLMKTYLHHRLMEIPCEYDMIKQLGETFQQKQIQIGIVQIK